MCRLVGGETGSCGAAQVRLTADEVGVQLRGTCRGQVIDHPWLKMGQLEQDNVLLAQAGPETALEPSSETLYSHTHIIYYTALTQM